MQEKRHFLYICVVVPFSWCLFQVSRWNISAAFDFWNLWHVWNNETYSLFSMVVVEKMLDDDLKMFQQNRFRGISPFLCLPKTILFGMGPLSDLQAHRLWFPGEFHVAHHGTASIHHRTERRSCAMHVNLCVWTQQIFVFVSRVNRSLHPSWRAALTSCLLVCSQPCCCLRSARASNGCK